MPLIRKSDNFPIREGTLLASRYKVQAFLSEGTFGKVAKCADTVTNTEVAIKIIKDKPCFTERALEEFELLDLCLSDFMKQRDFQPLSMGEIRPLLHQLTTALLHIGSLEIVHGDIKPENIMVVDQKQQPLQVKLIDFGLAQHASDTMPGTCVQSLWYRAPEVMLGLDFMEPIDMWSLGLIAAELAAGFPLFPGSHEYDMIKFIVDTLGMPPDHQLNCSQKNTLFFNIMGRYNQQTWKLKTPKEFAAQTGHHYRNTKCFHCLCDLEQLIYFTNRAETSAVGHFVDLYKKMLRVDKYERITPLKVLEHPFFSMEQHASKSNVIQRRPSVQKTSVASKAWSLHEEVVFTHPEKVSVKLEEEKNKASLQPGSENV
ncbi:homeodomain-interacting protein kinase 2-like [Toxotes jaculatrix]|uniref:homeodomain-interacting protein kinase 2-like n=1 Tax=Toxotes jaculatrix TaxID=941984 RepID=UPI001B3AAFE1|nr:homeodomain-interacting protein kinase 2-like [Toxotes jaculatrix]